MIRRCSTCGTPAPCDGAVFCNRCGARLPAFMSCRQCGKPVTDPESRFCDRCGSPLVPPVLAAVPPITLAKGKVCQACGFENFIDGARFCKKCGSILMAGGDAGPDRGPQERAAGTMPGGRVAAGQEPAGRPAAAPQGPAGGTAVPQQKPPGGSRPVQDIPRGTGQAAGQEPVQGRRSYRKIALGVAAAIVLVLMVLAVIFIGVPALSGNSTANATIPGLSGVLPGALSGYAPVINQSTPVVVDTPLDVK